MTDQPTETSAQPRNARPGKLFAILATLWASAVVLGLALLWSYASTPGPATAASPDWPADTTITRTAGSDRFTLLFFAHPQCPCTRASMTELAELLARSNDRIDTQVLIYHPTGFEDNWSRTDLWTTAQNIPNVTVSQDIDATQARHFGASTSGHVVLYSPAGLLLYSGGITKARGHEGDNLGSDAILAAVHGQTNTPTSQPVFGCPIY